MELEFVTEWLNQFINEQPPAKDVLTLETMEKLCEHFGHPERATPCFHVAGSKGKGSITTMIGSLLAEAGYRVGLYRSPHVVHFSERISSANGPFSEKIYKKAFEKLKTGVEELKSQGELPHVTWFELVTLYSFLVFKEAGCNYAVYEVGAGGRLDATNVVTPLACVISAIELEHTEFLGDTLEKIAQEKAGIMKPGVPTVACPQNRKVEKVLEKRAEEIETPILIMNGRSTNHYYLDNHSHPRMRIEELGVDLKLIGEFQATHAACAIAAIDLGTDLPVYHLVKGLERAELPGRFEVVTARELAGFSKIPYLLLDGAHTENSVKGVVENLEDFRWLLAEEREFDSCLTDFALDQKPLLLFGCGKHKNVKAMAKVASKHFDKVFLTRPGDFKEADLPAMEQAFASRHAKIEADEDYQTVIKRAFKEAEDSGRGLVVLGSFYLVGEVKKFLSSQIPF